MKKNILIAVLTMLGLGYAADVYFDAPLALPRNQCTGFTNVQCQPSLDTGNWMVRATPLFSTPLTRTVGDVTVSSVVHITVVVKAAELAAVPVTATTASEAQTQLRAAATRIALLKVQAALLAAPAAQTNALVR